MSSASERLAQLVVALLDELVEERVAERVATSAPTPERLLSVADVAEAERVSGDTVRSWIGAGKLRASRSPGTRSWRVRLADLERFRAGQATGPTPLRLNEAREGRAKALADRVAGKGPGPA